jgi:hypothetical protein
MPFFSRFFKEDQVASSWDYEGVMTVGTDEYEMEVGWNNFNNSYGSISPISPQVSGFNECMLIRFGAGYIFVHDSYYKCCNTIEINGIEFTGFDVNGMIGGMNNPFPAVGQTCTIKLK